MKRNLFAEISEGFDALAKQRLGKTTLADRKSNRMGAIMTHVLGITGLQPGPA